MKPQPLILDLDGSVVSLPAAPLLQPAMHWREQVRFGCRIRCFQQFWVEVARELPATEQYGTVMLGSGDFHHLSLPLLQHSLKSVSAQTPVRLVVFDNHPDNMRFPWGIHCGSWVRHAALLPQISHVHVVGITSGDIAWKHAWENYLTPLVSGKLTYWSTGVNVQWAHRVGLKKPFKHFENIDALCDAVYTLLAGQLQPTYLSIDKDVFSPSVVQTNWDQGQLTEAGIQHIITALSGSIIGSDITGEVSDWQYTTAWKRWLSAADGQQLAFGTSLPALQEQHAMLNQRLLLQLVESRA